MNRFVSLLLVALCLAAVSLAQPAQAQQWYRGLPYFLNGNTQSNTPDTTITATINNSVTGHLNITSTPTTSDPGYSTSGSYSGSVGVYYVWSGNNPTRSGTLTTTQSLEATGTGGYVSRSTGNSNAGGKASGDFSTYYDGWDQKASVPVTYHFYAGAAPPSENQIVSLNASASAYYNSSAPGAHTIVTADVTFGPPVVTYP